MWNESTSSMQAYIKKWFHDEQGAKIPEKLTCLV